MNFGGVGGLYSTSGNLYTGFKGLQGGLVVVNLVKLGFDFSISSFVRLYSGLFSSITKTLLENRSLTKMQCARVGSVNIPVLA